MKRIFTLYFLLFLLPFLHGQNLHPSIGVPALPHDTASVCTIPVYSGGFETSGLQNGDTAADFTLYDLNGDSFNLAAALALGKPVLLVGGNYTCPVFRNKVGKINSISSTFASQITTVIIYGVEAHPTDISPYSGTVNVTSANQSAGILYAQPLTYGDRKAIATDMLNDMTINAPVYLDGPCNNWWSYYGPAPNNAYLIDTNGIVFSKHGWFDQYPNDIDCDIDSILGIPTGCGNTNYNGSFTLNMISADTVSGIAGSTLTVELNLINPTTSAVLIMVKRMQNNLAPNWTSAMCADICYSATTDSITIMINPGDTQLFHFYFYSDVVPGMSSAGLLFRNVYAQNNSYPKMFYGITELVGLPEISGTMPLTIYPVPAENIIHIMSALIPETVEIMDVTGKIVYAGNSADPDISILSPGIYFVRVIDANGRIAAGKFVKR
ncbi:MAG TPA: T9SS type A sorting domain-containing protein [Bacteroidia bacterium]|nr:T9SS type A sorting domain-containing protein [Bacteroidia bacterium]